MIVDRGLQPSDEFFHLVDGTRRISFVVDGSDINRNKRITKDLMVWGLVNDGIVRVIQTDSLCNEKSHRGGSRDGHRSYNCRRLEERGFLTSSTQEDAEPTIFEDSTF